MGWVNEDGTHEGWLVAVEQIDDTHRWREIGNRYDEQRFDRRDQAKEPHGLTVRYLQVACECGWRSPRLYAPIACYWFPCIVCFHFHEEAYEEAGRRLWRAHVSACVEQHIDLSTILNAPRRGDDARCERCGLPAEAVVHGGGPVGAHGFVPPLASEARR